MRTRVKICGVMSASDAAMAASLGADAVGVVFYPSARRCVSVDVGREIVRAVGPYVTVVGLFVDQSAGEVREVCRAAGISCVQLQGHEAPEAVGELGDFAVIKAVKVVEDSLEKDVARWREAGEKHVNLKAILLESNTKVPGGSGVENDWAAIGRARAAGGFEGIAVVAAGGITPANVGRVVREVRPWGVDLSSGVEGEFGRKEEGKVAALLEEVRRADEQMRAAVTRGSPNRA